MQKRIIKEINQLNKSFYQNVASDFNESRQYFWQGWQKIPQYLKKNIKKQKKIKVLDIACGNARFATFLKSQQIDFQYYGLDSSQPLLKIAQETIAKEKILGQVINFDLIADYLKHDKISWPLTQQFHLITAFGLTHHLASHDLRLAFFQSLSELLADDALIIISNWQFAQDPRFAKNILNGQKIKENPQINPIQKIQLKNLLKNFSDHDYLLDWRKTELSQSKQASIRYCYDLSEQESLALIKQSGLAVVASFFADGKSQKLNQYFVLKKAV